MTTRQKPKYYSCESRNTKGITGKEAGKRQRRILFYRFWWERGPANISTSDFKPPEPGGKKCHFKPPTLWYFVRAALGN